MIDQPPPSRPPGPGTVDERDRAFSAVNAAFGSLGRVCMALDGDFRIRYASDLLGALIGPGPAAQARGRPVEELLGAEILGPDGPLRQALLAGEKREGWRAVLQPVGEPARLMSVSAAPLQRDRHGVCDPEARYLVVLRPADESTVAASGPIAGFGLIARSKAMAHVFRLIDTLQHSEATVLITGDSGTGKEVMARIIHAHSPRKSGPFVAFNAAALPGELLESELFGHVRGAFTGAVRDRVGRFEAADDGTLFLDEVGDVPLHLQVKLLRVLQEHAYERVGDNQTRSTNARIIAATNVDIRAALRDGRLREDLYYRLCVVPIDVPPLRHRREDIPQLALNLLNRVSSLRGLVRRISPQAMRVLLDYAWPGNVRELSNAMEYAVAVSKMETILPEDLPEELRLAALHHQARTDPDHEPAHQPHRAQARYAPTPSEQERLRAALDLHHWKKAETAKALGLSRSTLWRRMRELNLA